MIVIETLVTGLDGKPLSSTKRSIFARGEGGSPANTDRRQALYRRVEPNIGPILSLFDQAPQLESQRPQGGVYQQAVNPRIQTDHRERD